ncbi:hypothetical protein ACP70R_026293 [Stipagrostis hirtigluma subsp. patula]
MECKSEEGSPAWFCPAALALWLARFCSGFTGDGHDGPAGAADDDGNAPTTQMAAAAKQLTYSPHKIKFA